MYIVTVMIVSFVDVPICAVENSTQNCDEIIYEENVESEKWDGKTKESVYENNDIKVTFSLNGIWEVKPSSYAKQPKMQLGLNQLDRYVKAYGGIRGGTYIENGSIITLDNYRVNYYNLGNGLIIYNFKNGDKQPDMVTAPSTEKEEGYSYVPQTSPVNAIQFWGPIIGVALIGGTLAEDVLTGGMGITDDAASFALAYELIFGY